MTVRDALREGARILGAGEAGSEGSSTPFLDASLLLSFALGIPRDRLLAAGPEPLADATIARYRAALELRAAGRPVAYILGRKEFYGRDFLVDERVLVPRPDTELLVEAALRAGDALCRGRAPEARGTGCRLRVHEPCVGSGCVILSIALERPAWDVSASDIADGALSVATANAAALIPQDRPGGPCRLFASDLLAVVSGPLDLVVANPPYVQSAETDRLLARGWSEPRCALDGGEDGLALCRRLVPEAFRLLAPGGVLLVEAGEDQASRLRALFAEAGFMAVRSWKDLAGRQRVTEGRKPWTSV